MPERSKNHVHGESAMRRFANGLIYLNGVVMGGEGYAVPWMWCDHQRPDVAALPALYTDGRTEVMISTQAGHVPVSQYNPVLLIMIQVTIYHDPAVAFDVFVPYIQECLPIIRAIADTGHVIIVPEPEPKDWDTLNATKIITRYGHRGIFLDVGQKTSASLHDLLGTMGPVLPIPQN